MLVDALGTWVAAASRPGRRAGDRRAVPRPHGPGRTRCPDGGRLRRGRPGGAPRDGGRPAVPGRARHREPTGRRVADDAVLVVAGRVLRLDRPESDSGARAVRGAVAFLTPFGWGPRPTRALAGSPWSVPSSALVLGGSGGGPTGCGPRRGRRRSSWPPTWRSPGCCTSTAWPTAADGLLPPMDRARRLEVMADPTSAPSAWPPWPWCSCSRVAAPHRHHAGAAAAWRRSGARSRTMMAVIARTLPYARTNGLASAFLGGSPLPVAVLGTLLASVLAIAGGGHLAADRSRCWPSPPAGDRRSWSPPSPSAGSAASPVTCSAPPGCSARPSACSCWPPDGDGSAPAPRARRARRGPRRAARRPVRRAADRAASGGRLRVDHAGLRAARVRRHPRRRHRPRRRRRRAGRRRRHRLRSGVGATTAATFLAVAGRGLGDAAALVGDALAAGDLDAARVAVQSLVGRDPWALDEADIVRAVVESVAENTVDAVVAPACWAAAGRRARARSATGRSTRSTPWSATAPPATQSYGWASARLDDAANWVPARLTAALVVGVRPAAAASVLRAVRHDAPAHPSPNSGVAEAAFAAALGLRLGGESRYGDRVEVRPTLGDGRRPERADIGRAVALGRRGPGAWPACSPPSAPSCPPAAGPGGPGDARPGRDARCRRRASTAVTARRWPPPSASTRPTCSTSPRASTRSPPTRPRSWPPMSTPWAATPIRGRPPPPSPRPWTSTPIGCC